MDDRAGNALNEILRKLELLDSNVEKLTQRLDILEADKGISPETNSLLKESVAKPEPPVQQLASKVVVPPGSKKEITEPYGTTSFHDEATIIDRGAFADDVTEPVPPPKPPEIPAPSISLHSSKSPVRGPEVTPMQVAAAGLRPGTVPPRKPKESWEVRIATYWLPRIGLLFLALVCGLFAKEHAQGPVGKVIIAYLASIGLMVAGLWQEKKYPQWSRPVLAGGLAFSYFASYAMGFVEPMQLLDHLGAKLAILAVNLALIFGVAHWKKSEVIGGTALLLGYLTTGVVGNDVAAFSSSLALSVAALLFLWLNQWYTATAISAAATYIAHFYVWRALPEADTRSVTELFWHHFMFLSLYFVVFSAAALVGKKPALAENNVGPSPEKYTSRQHLLTVLVQTNVGAYLAGIIAVLKLTIVYWDKSYLFFFPLAGICALLGLMFIGLSSVQIVYLLAGTVSFSLGVMALASPMWLPIFMTAQGLVMLWFARGKYAELWAWLSLCVLGYGTLYLITNGQIDILKFSGEDRGPFPWWTFGAVAIMIMAYAIRWEKGAAVRITDPDRVLAYMMAAGAAFIWILMSRSASYPTDLFLYGMAIPIAAVVSSYLKSQASIGFIALAIPYMFADLEGLKNIGEWSTAPAFYWGLLGAAGFVAGYIVEKRQTTGKRIVSRFTWCLVYLWAALLVAIKISWPNDGVSDAFICLALFAACVAIGYLGRSSAIAKAGYVFALFAPVIFSGGETEPSPLAGIAISAGFLAVAYPVALTFWKYRTGDSAPIVNRFGQAFVVFVAWALFFRAVTKGGGWNPVLAHGIIALVCAVYATVGRFVALVPLYMLMGGTIGMLLMYRLGGNNWLIEDPDHGLVMPAVWSLIGVLLLVAGERVMALANRIKFQWSNPMEDWLKPDTGRLVTGIMAATTLVMAVMALRTLPDLKLFYFTGAMVAAAFLWIVFGFLFNEPVYRKSGFVLLCIGIIKGLVWDVLSLKETFYRIVSWSVLGLLALAASYLYTKFRSRISGTPEPDESMNQ